MVNWLNYCRGYLRIRVYGFAPERFLNLCSNKGFVLWNITRCDGTYEMFIGLSDFFQLRSVTRKTGTKVVVLNRYGLPFLLSIFNKRKFFVTGLVLAVSFWIFSDELIWKIEYRGNYQITDDMLDRFMEEENVRIGMRKQGLNIEKLEKDLRREYDSIVWTSARLSGTGLLIDIKENDMPPASGVILEEKGSDLISEYEGLIRSIIVRQGTPKVRNGDHVEKGTVLVEGTIPIYNDDKTVRSFQYVRADADIILEHRLRFLEELPQNYVTGHFTGRTTRSHFLHLFGKNIRWKQKSAYLSYDSLIDQKRPILFEKLKIPVYWGAVTDREYVRMEKAYTQEEAGKILTQKFIHFVSTLEEKGVQILEKDVKIYKNDFLWTITGELLVQEPVESRKDIKIQEMEE